MESTEILVISTTQPLSMELVEKIKAIATPLAKSMNMKVMVLPDGMKAEVHTKDQAVALMLEEQRKTNQLLSQLIQSNSQLIEALSEDDEEDDGQHEPMTYMDGTPVHGYQPAFSGASTPPGDE